MHTCGPTARGRLGTEGHVFQLQGLSYAHRSLISHFFQLGALTRESQEFQCWRRELEGCASSWVIPPSWGAKQGYNREETPVEKPRESGFLGNKGLNLKDKKKKCHFGCKLPSPSISDTAPDTEQITYTQADRMKLEEAKPCPWQATHGKTGFFFSKRRC